LHTLTSLVQMTPMFLALCSKSLQLTDLGIHYAHMPLKTDTKRKVSGDRNTEARPQTRTQTTLRLGTYSHYRDEPNKEMHTVFIYTTACYTYSKHKNKLTHDYARTVSSHLKSSQ